MASILSALHTRAVSALGNDPDLVQMDEIHISFHVYPEDLDLENGGRSADISLYPDLKSGEESTKAFLGIKRAIDILGSATALLLLSPLFLVIGAVIKLTSEGPIFFKQQRLGRSWSSLYVPEIQIDVLPERFEGSPGLRPAAYFREG